MKNYEDYEIPKDLIFKTKDITDMHGLDFTTQLSPADFKDALESPSQIKSISLKLKFSVLSKEILAQGTVYGAASVQCSRCLEMFDNNFREEFTSLSSLKDEIIDIMSITRQSLALFEGIQNLCSQTCKGLCVVCGANKNKVNCTCKEQNLSPFACLKDHFTKDKKEHKKE
jgi:uncharacterized protein